MSKPFQSKKNKTTSHAKSLHFRNLHKHGYNFQTLIKSYPALSPYVKINTHGNFSINFSDPFAVKALNCALLKRYYNIIDWDIPEGNLCPPIPGRVDYIHYIAELLEIDKPTSNPSSTKSKINLLDIGTGANGIYPLLACQIYGWRCVGSDISTRSLDNVASIIAKNPALRKGVTLRIQKDKNQFFCGIIQAGEFFDVTVCNPPFHASPDEALKSNRHKINRLAKNRDELITTHVNTKGANKPPSFPALNFGGLDAELWCKGGERLFLKKLIKESVLFSNQCRWFTSLVSKSDNLTPLKKLIRKLGATDIRVINMAQGNKITRILAWTFI